MPVNAIFWASAEILIAAAQLGSERDHPPPERLRADMLAMLQRMVSQCRAYGIPDAETAEARYALVAFVDERILKSNWPGRAEWMNSPLQMQLYREYTAGENFFVRMGALLQRPQGSVALEIYYLCLALGFTGASASSAHAQSYLDAVRTRTPKANPDALSPHAIPPDHYVFTTPRRPLVLGLVLTCALVVALGLGLLGWSMGSTLRRSEEMLGAESARRAVPLER